MSEAYQELLDEKATFCLVTGIPPSEYDLLTMDEVNTFIEVFNDINKKG